MGQRLYRTFIPPILVLLMLPSIFLVSGADDTGSAPSHTDPELPAPELLSPENNSWAVDYIPTFCWTYSGPLAPEDNVSFALQVDNEDNFCAPTIDTGYYSNNMSYRPTSELGSFGTYFWHVRAKNATGAESPWSETWNVSIDCDWPYLRPINWLGYVTNRIITLQLSAYDRGGGLKDLHYSFDDQNWSAWQPYSTSISVTLPDKDQRWNISVQVRDLFDHPSCIRTTRAILDRVLPVGTILINNGTDSTDRSTVRLNISANDTNGVPEMQVSNHADFRDAKWQNFTSDLNWSLLSKAGWLTVYARFRDKAGLVSLTYSASIYVDLLSPSVELKLNNGSFYTMSRSIIVQLKASDDFEVESVAISYNSDLSGALWQPFNSTIGFELSDYDGPHTLYAGVRDAAGNVGIIANATIGLDRVPPATEIIPLPPTTNTTQFVVGWGSNDVMSGVLSYDVQYRENNGPWTDWLTGTWRTQDFFTGVDGIAYCFRARAQDRAGNIGPFEVSQGAYTLVVLLPPLVAIEWPSANGQIKGQYLVSGTAAVSWGGPEIQYVEIKIDNGQWVPANGTRTWSYQLDSMVLKDGTHSLQARSYDGVMYSDIYHMSFDVANEEADGEAGSPFPIVAGVGIAMVTGAIVVAAFGLVFRRKKR